MLTTTDILLSLTRTRRAGYIRDLRRITVALSRARLGLYVFGRREVFESVFELQPAFERLFARPTTLALVTGEMFPTERPVDADIPAVDMTGVEHLGQYVFEMTNTKIKMLQDGGVALPPATGESAAEGERDDSAEEEGGVESEVETVDEEELVD
jgi:intron-binding protein aquarius